MKTQGVRNDLNIDLGDSKNEETPLGRSKVKQKLL